VEVWRNEWNRDVNWCDGKVITCTFKDGRRQFKGAMKMPNGDQYDGETLDEIPNGEGTMIFAETGDR
jgi:hypothetical protein